jgi:hypothetical protein
MSLSVGKHMYRYAVFDGDTPVSVGFACWSLPRTA